MNRETLDGIVKQGLVKYADDLLVQIGRECSPQDFDQYPDCAKWAAGRIGEREYALALLRDDARRLEIVDRILKEMKP